MHDILMEQAERMTVMTEIAGRTVDANGVATRYHDVGSGEPVLLLHGSGPGVSAWLNWQGVIPSLAERYRVVAPDIVGFGHTERPDDIRYSLQTWVDHVRGFLDALEIERAAVVGNSLGARIAVSLAAQHPERLSKMVLMGSPGPGMTPSEGLIAMRAYEPSAESMRDLLVTYIALDPTIITPELVRIRHEASVAPGVHETYQAMFNDPKHAGGDLAFDLEELAQIATPTLIVHGREDRVIPVESGLSLLDVLPNADLHVFSRCGHWTQIERSGEFLAVVDQFLSS